jgi:hypothetical protein
MHQFWLIPALSMSAASLAIPSVDQPTPVPLQKPAEIVDLNIAPDLGKPETEIIALQEERNERYTMPVTIGGAGPYMKSTKR